MRKLLYSGIDKNNCKHKLIYGSFDQSFIKHGDVTMMKSNQMYGKSEFKSTTFLSGVVASIKCQGFYHKTKSLK